MIPAIILSKVKKKQLEVISKPLILAPTQKLVGEVLKPSMKKKAMAL